MMKDYLIGSASAEGVTCEIRVQAGVIPDNETIRTQAMYAMEEAILHNDQAHAPWMCACGHEGDCSIDGGICPVCHGRGLSECNG